MRNIAFKIGQMAVDDDFMISEQSDIFVNSAFGAIASQTGTPLHSLPDDGHEEAFPVYPVAAPGVHLAWSASGPVSWQTGLYHGGPGRDIERNRGFDPMTPDGAGKRRSARKRPFMTALPVAL